MSKRKIYLDHNATTPLHPEVKKALKDAMELFGNASSLHDYGRATKAAIEKARKDIAGFINAKPDEVIFTGSGSESNNTVLNIVQCCSSVCNVAHGHRHEIITSKIEHPCILESSKCLLERGTPVTYIKVDKYGKVDIDELKKKISKKTLLVSIMMANNEIGTIEDVKRIAKITHDNGALFHTDAVQAVGKVPVDVRALNVDFLSFSAHKIYGPKGIGGLYVRSSVPFCPLIRGGHQEQGRRAGTENTLGIIGLAKALQMRKKEMSQEAKRFLGYKKRLKKAIEDKIPKVSFNGHPTDSLTSTLNVSFEGSEGEAILLYLDMEGIAVSTGSACASGSLDPSHVLLAVGLGPEKAHGAIRFSMGRDTTKEDIDYVIEKLPKVIKKVRDISSAYPAKK
ncbi:MAG: cysteine desulfurase [Candidatus Omnitrophica bacterium]|nr:cysteine desulfurase [Candidatus Omnitrophota bacterium]